MYDTIKQHKIAFDKNHIY